MTDETKSAHLAQLREKFARQWKPIERQYQTEFQIDLDQLIYVAFAVAQEPFIAELNSFKAHALTNPLTELLRPHVSNIKQSAAAGNLRAKEIITLYHMHCDCPSDPEASALCQGAFDKWLSEQPK